MSDTVEREYIRLNGPFYSLASVRVLVEKYWILDIYYMQFCVW